MKQKAICLLGVAVAGCLAATIVSPAVADEAALSPYEALQAIDAESAEFSGQDVLTSLAGVDAEEDGEYAVDETVADSTVTVPSDPADPVEILADDISLTVKLPGADTSSDASVPAEGVVEYENSEGFSVFPLVKDDASVQFTTVINGPDAPTSYEYVIGESDLTVEIAPDGYALFSDVNGDFAGASLPAWAVDANGVAVPTHFEADGNVLRQVVSHTDTSVAYPVVADPYMGKALISKVTKTTEKKKPRYGVKKTTWGNTVAIGYGLGPSEDPLLGAYIMRTQGWSEAVKKGTSTAKTIKQQYECHTVFAAGKNPWNLEAHRATRNNWLVSPKLCNW